MDLGTARWLHRAMWLWLIWMAAGAAIHLLTVFLSGDAWTAFGDYPESTALEIAGVPLLLLLVSRLHDPGQFRTIAVILGVTAALLHLAVTSKGFPAVQIVYVGLAATVPPNDGSLRRAQSPEDADSRPW